MVERLKRQNDECILSGAKPEYRNFERISFHQHGIVIHFDRYQVGSGAEGEYEVFVPTHEVRPMIEPDIIDAVQWR